MSESIWPDESKGTVDFHENTILLYGKPKIGKTTFGSQAPNTLFIETEDGQKHVKVHGWRVRTWLEFCSKVALVTSNITTCPYKTVVIDTVDNLWDLVDTHICEQHKVKSLLDIPFGKGYTAATKEFKKQVNQLASLGLGVIFISHAEEREVDADSIVNPYAPMLADQDSGKLSMILPTISDKRARKFLLGLSDMILYATVNGNGERVLHSSPSKFFEAGDRSGRLSKTMPLSYAAVVESYYKDNRTDILDTIGKAEKYLKEKAIPFEPMADYNAATIPQLEAYLQGLRMKAKNQPKGAKA